MKNKLIAVLITSVFIFSTFSVALAADICPRCNGTGKVTERQPCPTCQGSASAQANIISKGKFVGGHSSMYSPIQTSIKGIFHNEGEVGVYGTVTGEIKTSIGTFTNTSETYFPPNEDVTVTVPILIEGIDYAPDWAYFIQVTNVGSVDCPDCGGTGFINVVTTCPDCGGTGVLTASFGEIGNVEGIGGIVVGVAVVGAVIGASFFIMKKRRVTEETLRRLSSFEFQDWAAKRLGSSSQSGSYLGIDGFTAEGYPFQVRQEDHVGKRAIDSFAVAVGRAKARSGTIVAFSFGRDAIEGVTRARLNYRLEIKTVTVRELLIGQNRIY
jgi:hypothetical protein